MTDPNQCAGQVRQGQTVVPVIVLEKVAGVWQFVTEECAVIQQPVVTPGMVRERAVRLIPSAKVGLAPRAATLVNIQTIMWVDASPEQALPPVEILGQLVEIRIKLDHVDWSFGDGASGATSGPAKAYDAAGDPCKAVRCPDYFGHTYRDTGKVTVRATAYWRASFTVDGGEPVDIPGTVAGPAGTAPLTVKQAHGVLIPTPGGR